MPISVLGTHMLMDVSFWQLSRLSFCTKQTLVLLFASSYELGEVSMCAQCLVAFADEYCIRIAITLVNLHSTTGFVPY